MLEDVQDYLKDMAEFSVTNITILYFGPENTRLAADALGKRLVRFAEIESAAREVFPGIQIAQIELSSEIDLPLVLNSLQF